MAVYICYDPTNGNKIRQWVQCTSDNISLQSKETYEVFAEIAGPPPILGRTEKIYNPTTGAITDGATDTSDGG